MSKKVRFRPPVKPVELLPEDARQFSERVHIALTSIGEVPKEVTFTTLEKALTDGLLDVKRAESRVKRARGEDNG